MRRSGRRGGGQARPVHPRARGLGAQRADQRRRPLGGVRRRSATRGSRSRRHLDRPPGPRGGRGARARDVRRLRRDPGDARQPDRRDGAARLSGRGAGVSRLGLPIVNLPGCPVQPDNITETLLHLACSSPASTPDARARRRRAARAGCSSARCTRAAAAPASPSRASSRRRRRRPRLPGEARLQGPGGQVQRPDPRLDRTGSAAARTSAASASRARCPASPTSSCRSWSRTGSGRSPPAATRFTYGPGARSASARRGMRTSASTSSPSGGAATDRLETGYRATLVSARCPSG